MRMDIVLRRATPDDAAACGRIEYEAFKAIAAAHNFPPAFPPVEIATGLCAMLLAHPGFVGVVAELGAQPVGRTFLDPHGLTLPGYVVRPAAAAALAACSRLCRRVHGHDRSGELCDAIQQGTAMVVEHLGRISGYATAIGWFHHAVGETNEDLKALIGAAPSFPGPGFLVPTRNGELVRWCLAHGLRIASQGHLMTLGLYNEPAAAYLPSVLY